MTGGIAVKSAALVLGASILAATVLNRYQNAKKARREGHNR